MAPRRTILPALGLCLWLLGCRNLLEAFLQSTTGHAQRELAARRVNVFGEMFTYRGDPGAEDRPAEDVEITETSDGAKVVEINLPLGVKFEEGDGGNIFIKDVEEDSDAWRKGVRPGAQMVSVSSTFGDEMWNAKGVGMSQFTTVVASRFGQTIKLAVIQKDEAPFAAFMEAFTKRRAPAEGVKEEKSQEQLMQEFAQKEAKLQDSPGLWNPFR